MSVLKVKNANGEWVSITSIKGEKGDKGDGLTPEQEYALIKASTDASEALDQTNAHLANKNNPHGVTPSQIGAVSKNGDAVNGNLNVNGAFMVERSDNNRKARTVVHNNADKEADFQNFTDDSNYVGIRLATEEKGAGDAAKVVHMKNGQFASFPILHTGNKEKIFTFGTDDLEAGTSPLGTGQLYFVYE